MRGEPLTINVSLLRFQLEGPVPGFAHLPRTRQHKLMHYVEPAVRAEAMRQGYKVESANSAVDVRPHGGMGQTAFATRRIGAGEVLFTCGELALPFPTMYTICTAERTHALFGAAAECIAHGCEPNTQVVVRDGPRGRFDLVATREIAEGEPLQLNYLNSEWTMNTAFDCLCGSAKCYGRIAGACNVPLRRRGELMALATPVVAERIGAVAPRDLSRGDIVLDYVIAVTDVLVTDDGAWMLSHATRYAHDAADPAVAFIEGRLIALRGVAEGEPLSINVSALRLTLPRPMRGFMELSRAEQEALTIYTEPALRAEAARAGFRVVSGSEAVVVHGNGDMGEATFAARNLAEGEVVFHVTGLLLPYPTMYTIRTTPSKHLLFSQGAQCLAHSCDPNVRITVSADGEWIDVVTLRAVAEGELLSFNYLTTEWSMNTAFNCLCGAPRCFGRIAGFQHLDEAQRRDLLPLATPAIHGLTVSRHDCAMRAASATGTTALIRRWCWWKAGSLRRAR